MKTLDDFAAAMIPAHIDTEGYDDPTPRPAYWSGSDRPDDALWLYGGDTAWAAKSRAVWARKKFLRHYRAQCTWSDRVAALLSNPAPWYARPVPQAKATTTAPTTAHVLPPQSVESKAFRKALKALGPDWQRDATPSHAGGACAQCLYEAMGVIQPYLPIPHTCAKVNRRKTPKRARRRRRI